VFYIDTEKCSGCGACVEVCPQRAVALIGGKAVINHRLCTECGNCLDVCPVGAIYEEARQPQFVRIKRQAQSGAKGKEVSEMPFGRVWGGVGMGRGIGFGRGFGFRGFSPPYPYVGRGQGGLPRCWYPGVAWGAPYYAWAPAPGTAPYATPSSREQELGYLKEEASYIKARLDEIEARIKELEKEEK
jgi:NAD-dependent dihydropyrimidine dehydrogenase PreA subunit